MMIHNARIKTCVNVNLPWTLPMIQFRIFSFLLFNWLLKSEGVFAWTTNSFQFLVVDFNQAYVRMCQVKRHHFFYSSISFQPLHLAENRNNDTVHSRCMKTPLI